MIAKDADAMKKGLYLYNGKVYSGFYDEKQVSGQASLAMFKPEQILSEYPTCESDWAVQLWDNHRLLEPEYAGLKTILLKMGNFINLNIGHKVDFSATETRLGIKFPNELKAIYTALHNQTEYFTATEHFIPLDEIYAEQGTLVFFKKRRSPIAGYDMASGRLSRYYKKEWNIEPSDFSCYQFCVGRIITIALENKPICKKGRCKGRLVTALNIVRELKDRCKDQYYLLSEFNVYGIAALYSDEKLIAWIRSNGFYADIHAGADDEAQLEKLGDCLGDITWK